jgi:AraC-like DNA-binding protein
MNDKPALTVAEVAALTGFSRQTVTRIFEKEKGVLILEHLEKMHKRGYRSIRIPRAVYERVVRRLSV